MNKKMRQTQLTIGIILFLVIAGVITVYFAANPKGQFDTRQRAATPTGGARLSFDSGSFTHYLGDIFPVKVTMMTNGDLIDRVRFYLRYTYTNVAMEIEPWDKDANNGAGLRAIRVIDKILPLDPGFQVTSQDIQVNPSTKTVTIVYEARHNGAGYSNTSPQQIAEMWFKVNAPIAAGITITPDLSESVMIRKSDQQDILKSSSVAPFLVTLPADATTTPPIFNLTTDPIVATTSYGLTLTSTANTSTSSGTLFSWKATEKPDRASDTIVPIKYAYGFDAALDTAPTADSTVVKTFSLANKYVNLAQLPPPVVALKNGSHTLKIWAQDATGNKSLVAKFPFNLNYKPHIDTWSINHGSAGKTQGLGDVVSITGYNFGATQGTVGSVGFIQVLPIAGTTPVKTVGTVGSINSEMVAWSNNSITFKVPATIPATMQTANVYVYGNDGGTVLQGENYIPNFVIETKVVLQFKLQKVTLDQGSSTRSFTMQIKCAVTAACTGAAAGYVRTYTLNGVWDNPTQSYKTTATLDGTIIATANAYSLWIKDKSHLAKKYANITLAPTKLNIAIKTASTDILPGGDFEDPIDQFGDNNININDWVRMKAQFDPTRVKTLVTNNTKKQYDLNQDGYLTIEDAAILFTNYINQDNPGAAQ